MTSSLHKKRRTTRRSILRWMQDSIRLSVGLSCICGYSSLCAAGDALTASPRPAASAGRATVDRTAVAIKSPTKTLKKTTRTAARVIRAQNEFEETPAAPERSEVVPPPVPTAVPAAPHADAIQRLRDRSAKARWDEMHQEWLRARKNREAAATPLEQQPPAAEEAVDSNSGDANSFESDAVPETKTAPENSALEGGNEPAIGTGVTKPSVAPGRVFLQSQPKPRVPFKTDTDEQIKEKVQMELDAAIASKIAAPIRNPAALPKISEIDPNPIQLAEPAGRPVPDLEKKTYVKLGETPYIQRAFPDFTYTFEATNVYSNPLYFEDPTLERYGHTHHPLVQPIVSVARFGAQVVFFPYQVAMKPFGAKIYPLGWYGPGEYVPYRCFQPPLNAKAAAAEAGTILGFSYALP